MCAIKILAKILNNFPMFVQRTQTDTQHEDFLHPLTPNMLILLDNSGVNQSFVINPDDKDPRVRIPCIAEIERFLWYHYREQFSKPDTSQKMDQRTTEHAPRQCSLPPRP